MPDALFNGLFDYERDLPVLRTPRLVLRPLRSSDDSSLVEIFSDPRSLETWFRAPFNTVEKAREYRATLHEGFRRRSLFIWGVFAGHDEDDAPLAGVAILTRWSALHRRIDVGYYLASEFWGRGYATEATRALMAFAFDSLGVHRIEAEVVPGNDASVRVLERAGFVYEATLKQRLWGDDGPEDSMLFRVFRDEYVAAAQGSGD